MLIINKWDKINYTSNIIYKRGNMKKFYGSLIFFFYFIKYPVVIYILVNYYYLDGESSLTLNVLGVISLILILKDLFFPHKKSKNCAGVKK